MCMSITVCSLYTYELLYCNVCTLYTVCSGVVCGNSIVIMLVCVTTLAFLGSK